MRLGGAKKKSISQMARQQQLKDEAAGKEKKEDKEKRKTSKSVKELFDEGEVLKAIKDLRAVTPHALATQLNVRVGVAKRVLRGLEEKGSVKVVSGSSRLRVYGPS
jgi:ribosomal protein S25